MQKIRTNRPELFDSDFHIHPTIPPDATRLEIAADFGVVARSDVWVSVNNKLAAHRLPEVACLIRKALEDGQVVVLFNGETPYP